MAPKAKVKAPEAPVGLVSGPLDGSVAIDFAPVLAAIEADDPQQHLAVAESIGMLPRSASVQVRQARMTSLLQQLAFVRRDTNAFSCSAATYQQ